MDYFDELAASHATYAQDAEIKPIGHDDQYVAGIFRIVLYPPDNAEIPVAGIVLYGIPCFTP
ncbi:MAG: hypothetical protein ACLRTA_05500 [Clostridia bacterium]